MGAVRALSRIHPLVARVEAPLGVVMGFGNIAPERIRGLCGHPAAGGRKALEDGKDFIEIAPHKKMHQLKLLSADEVTA